MESSWFLLKNFDVLCTKAFRDSKAGKAKRSRIEIGFGKCFDEIYTATFSKLGIFDLMRHYLPWDFFDLESHF